MRMLSALISSPGTMARNAGVYITVFFLVLVQGLFSQFVPDSLALAEQAASLSPDTVMGNLFSIGAAVLVIFVQLTLSLYILAAVSSIVGGTKIGGARAADGKKENASLVSLARLAGIILIIGGALLVLASFVFQFLVSANGIVSFILFLLLLFLLLALFGGLILFGFAPSFMGKGFALRDALAQSWKLSTQHIWGTVLLFLALVFITGIAEPFLTLATDALSNEWIILLVNTLLAALLAYYGATVLANALPSALTPETNAAVPRHGHTK